MVMSVDRSGSAPARLMVCGPAPRLKMMVSATAGVALAAVIASRRVVSPSPAIELSAVLLTTIVTPHVGGASQNDPAMMNAMVFMPALLSLGDGFTAQCERSADFATSGIGNFDRPGLKGVPTAGKPGPWRAGF